MVMTIKTKQKDDLKIIECWNCLAHIFLSDKELKQTRQQTAQEIFKKIEKMKNHNDDGTIDTISMFVDYDKIKQKYLGDKK